jgi:uncharacterized phage protein (TIGR01671 family)
MREIKFRAWDKTNKKMIAVGMYESQMLFFKTPLNYIDRLPRPPEPEMSEPMQYTGLKDKNGKEIYEGDIVQASEMVGQVFWNDFSSGFRFAEEPDADIEKTYYLNKFAQSQYVVIGNIYENPGLVSDNKLEGK